MDFWLLLVWFINIANSQDISQLFSYPIHDLNDAQLQNLMSNAIEFSIANNYFKINNFLTKDAVNLLKQLSLSTEIKEATIRRDLWKSIFGDQTDYINFPNTTKDTVHPRNILGNLKLGTVGKTALPKIMSDIFEYEPLLTFLKEIVTRNGWFNDLYLSADTDGSCYIFSYENGDFGEWHFDQHPFTCVYMILKPDYGGKMEFYYDSNNNHNYNWNIIGKILRNETDAMNIYVNEIESNESDMYCFKGNITLHRTQHSFNKDVDITDDSIIRSILVLSYADYPGFKHSQYVLELNAWGKEKNNYQNCQGNKDCVSMKAEL